ncbi:MAG: glycosyltransferase [Tannerella sp.]|jgi:rhamnosyl/mannosyltransferase|nr:glycosyltransferase [Tannerella sp.]
MKILQVGKFYPVMGGVEKVMYDLTLGLSGRHIPCDMLCAAAGKHPPGMIQLNEFARLLCMPVRIKISATMISPAMILKLRKIRREYDIIHIHHPDPMACLALFLSGYKGKVVLHWHSDILKQKMLLKLYKPLQQWLIKRADIIVGTTPVYVRQSPFLKKVRGKLDDIPIGIDPLEANPDSIARIKKRYEGKKIIFSLGRLVEYKGYEYLINAALYLGDDYMILIGGNGPLKGALSRLIEKLGVCSKVELLGFIPDQNEIAAYFMACDVFCLSSIWKTEAFGIVQIEAMSCGKPVVATCIAESGVSWVNADGVSGYNVEPGNAEALADAIKRILTDPERYAELSVGARHRFETMFTQEKMMNKCLKLYHDLLG